MVHSSIMTLFMAGEKSPAFHDFLGLSRREEFKQREPDVSDIAHVSRKDTGCDDETEGEVSTRPSSISYGQLEASVKTTNGSLAFSFPTSSDPDSEHLSWGKAASLQHHGNRSGFYRHEGDGSTGKKRDSSNTRDLFQERTQMNADAPPPRSMKVSRVEGQDDRKGRHQIVGVDDLHLTMQPPRLSSKCPTVLQSSIFKTDFSLAIPKKWDSFKEASVNTVILGQARSNYAGAQTEKIFGSCSRENTTVTSHNPLPPADEGSRTGLQGSSMASLLNNGSATPPAKCPINTDLTPGRSKLWSHNTGTRYQTMATTSRQLTIFYGGQAHVFDDVPPDKAEAIMALAGSSGRSWSTTYSPRPRPRGSLASSATEASISVLERGRERIVTKDSAVNGLSSLALSSDLHTILATPIKAGSGGNRIGHINQPEGNFAHLSQSSTDIHATTENRDSAVVHSSATVDEARKEV